jgi:ATP/maltotriose-dependent transcriptional regulator MalT
LISDTDLRRWLTVLRQPARLADTDLARLLRSRGDIPANASDVGAGKAVAEFLIEVIDRLKPDDDASRENHLPHVVLRTCFVDGAKLFQAASRLGISERQLSRERARSISLLRTEIEAALGVSTAAAPTGLYRPQPIPVIAGYLPRPRVMESLQSALANDRLVVVAGPPGIGKTSLVADLAAAASERATVLWYRFRHGVNDSMAAVLYELGEMLASEGSPQLAAYIAESLPTLDVGIATRLAIRGLDGADRLLVLDDFHVVESENAIGGFIDDAITRLPRLRVAVISRHRDTGLGDRAGFDVPVFSRPETKALLKHLGVDAAPSALDGLYTWTTGVPQLLNLAAAWLKTALPEEVASGMTAFTSRMQVQAFLLGTITELLDADDRAILEAASIFRGPFSDDGVAAVARTSRGAVLDASLRLVRAHVATRSADGRCAFFHASVRDYVYDRLPPVRRAELHPRAAAWLHANGEGTEAKYHRDQAARAEVELAPPAKRPARTSSQT